MECREVNSFNIQECKHLNGVAGLSQVASGVLIRYAVTLDYTASPSRGKTGMKNLLMRLWQDEKGQDLVEYAFLMAFVALAATVGMNTVATAINTIFTVTAAKLTAT